MSAKKKTWMSWHLFTIISSFMMKFFITISFHHFMVKNEYWKMSKSKLLQWQYHHIMQWNTLSSILLLLFLSSTSNFFPFFLVLCLFIYFYSTLLIESIYYSSSLIYHTIIYYGYSIRLHIQISHFNN